MANNETLKTITIAFIIALLIAIAKDRYLEWSKDIPRTQNIQQEQVKVELTDDSQATDVPIAPMQEFSGKSAAEILKLRKAAVAESPAFYNKKNYEPNPSVFNIEDGLQWISAHEVSCNGANNNKNIGKGESRESTGILNPELMLYVVVANLNSAQYNYCSSVDYLRPYKVTYNPNTKTISAYINYKDFRDKNNGYRNIVLADANARDLGYNYVTADLSQNIRYRYDSNLSNRIISTNGFYHRGYACGLKEGCNNYSPYESGYEFYLTDLPAKVHMKLWENNPLSERAKADLNYEMIFN